MVLNNCKGFGLKLSYKWLFAISLVCSFMISPVSAAPLELLSPVKCRLGVDCFLQQMPDMDLGSGVSDPFCGSASYNTHTGTDIRLLSMADIKRNVPVIAVAGGVVKALRDGETDRIVLTAADRTALKGRECGNGVLIDHGNSIQTQYCHMQQNSISVRSGQKIKAGDKLGYVGASGLVQFPHLHITVRLDGKDIDPFTGKALGEACTSNRAGTWWKDNKLNKSTGDVEILKTGFAGQTILHDQLVLDGGPPAVTLSDKAIVGWVWFANLKAGDEISMSLSGPNGFKIKDTTKPFDRNKASWSGFIGKSQAPQKGLYIFEVQVLRNGKLFKTQQSKHVIE